MTLAEFQHSLSDTKPPAKLSPALAALWWAGQDNWDKAHEIVMNDDSQASAWVHAHLHRTEGDFDNAGYWYRQAAKPIATGELRLEWGAIASVLLGS
jgi:hypothetical protein